MFNIGFNNAEFNSKAYKVEQAEFFKLICYVCSIYWVNIYGAYVDFSYTYTHFTQKD